LCGCGNSSGGIGDGSGFWEEYNVGITRLLVALVETAGGHVPLALVETARVNVLTLDAGDQERTKSDGETIDDGCVAIITQVSVRLDAIGKRGESVGGKRILGVAGENLGWFDTGGAVGIVAVLSAATRQLRFDNSLAN